MNEQSKHKMEARFGLNSACLKTPLKILCLTILTDLRFSQFFWFQLFSPSIISNELGNMIWVFIIIISELLYGDINKEFG